MVSTALHSSPRDVAPGIRVYSRPFLHLYDALVIGVLTRYLWKCPGIRYVQCYDANIRTHHADIGVGTGYFLDACRTQPGQRITLIDLNPNCLAFAARRLARYQPTTIRHNVFDPLAIESRRFDSVCLGGILHCLPGSMAEKAQVFDAIAPALAPGAIVFGYTLVRHNVDLSLPARAVCWLLNAIRVINNRADSLAALKTELMRRFSSVTVMLVGGNAFFTASNP